MPVSFIANSAAQLAQSAIRVRNEALTTGASRLSSGLRVSSAGDDAAALAVGTSLKITNRGLATAALNASAAVSTLQIADGALNNIGDLLIRMQALATQASSGQNDDAIRALIDAEFQNLKTEVNRISQVTEFNEVKLLAGARGFTNTAGSNLAASGIAGVRLDPNLTTADRTLRFSYSALTESLTVTRLDDATSTSQSIDITALLDAVGGVGQNLAPGSMLDVSFASIGVTLSLDSNFARATDITAGLTAATGPTITVVAPLYAPATTNTPQDVALALNSLVAGYDVNTGNLALPITSAGATVRFGPLAGVAYRVNGGAMGASGAASVTLPAAGPNTIEVFIDRQLPNIGMVSVGSVTTGAVSTTGPGAGTVTIGAGTGLLGADYLNNNAATRLTYKIGTGVAAGQDLLNVDIPAFNLVALGVDTLSVTSVVNADAAISAIKLSLATLNQGRATVGAQQLRLEQIASNIGVVTINNEAARSALIDADISQEIAEYTANQALLEAGVAMLSRANQLPNVLLQLLRNG